MEETHALDFMEQALQMGVATLGLSQHGMFTRSRFDSVVTVRGWHNEVPRVSSSGAAVQLQRGSQDDDTQAAHLVPRNFAFNSQDMWDHVPAQSEFLRNAIRGILGRTNVLPSRVNRLDSLLERSGVVRAYQAYLQDLVAIPRTLVPDSSAALRCFRVFQAAVLEVCRQVRGNLAADVQRGGSTATRSALQLAQLDARIPVLRDYQPDMNELRLIYEMFTSELPAPLGVPLLTAAPPSRGGSPSVT
jgi:hypothetical protein